MAEKWYLKKDDASWFTFWDKTTIDSELNELKNAYPKMLTAILENSHKESVVLEGGCGLGKFLFYLKENGYNHLIGVDITDKPLNIIKLHDPVIDVRKGDVNDLPIDNESIDLYLSMGVIEHFEDGPKKALDESSRVLRKKGILIIAVPYQNLYRGTFRKYITMPVIKLFRPSFRNKNRVFYQYYYSKKDLIKYINESGFEIIDWFYNDQFHKKRERIGLYVEFPFLKSKSGERYKLNWLGQIIAFLSDILSQGIFSSGILYIVKKSD